MNVIILALMLAFYYFISQKVSYLCLSSDLFHSFSSPLPARLVLLHHRGRPRRGTHTAAIFSPLSSHFSSLLLFPPLRAEEPQCLLLTFSYHLSPFHHHHYLPLLSVIYSRLPRLSPPPLSLTICLFRSHQYSPSLADRQVSSAPTPPPPLYSKPTFIPHDPNTSSHLFVACYACQCGHLILARSQRCQESV